MDRLITSILILVVVIAASTASALEIIYPADKTSVNRSDYLIIRAGAFPVVDSLSISINGEEEAVIDISAPEYKKVFGDKLIIEPSWELGINKIKISSIVGGKPVENVSAEFFYLPITDAGGVIPPGYKPFIMHIPEREAKCAPCHNMQVTSEQIKKSPTEESSPCATCHKRMQAKKHVHGPEGVFQCSDCHENSSKPSRWQVTRPEIQICGECHADKLEEFKKKAYVHGPVAVGTCTICHDPHASDFPVQLHDEVNVICLSCHANVAKTSHVLRGIAGNGHPLKAPKNPALPEKALDCTGCHNPHSGMGEYFYPKDITSRFTLCQMCHQK